MAGTYRRHQPHGNPAQAPYGRKRVKEKLVDHMAEARVIKAITEMRAQGLTLRQIAQFLSQIAVPTKMRGKAWHPQMIARILAQNQRATLETAT